MSEPGRNAGANPRHSGRDRDRSFSGHHCELTHGVQRSKLEAQRQRSQAFVDEVLASVPVYPVTTEVAQRAGVLSGEVAERRITLHFEDL